MNNRYVAVFYSNVEIKALFSMPTNIQKNKPNPFQRYWAYKKGISAIN